MYHNMAFQPCNLKHVLPRKLSGPLYGFPLGVGRIGPNLDLAPRRQLLRSGEDGRAVAGGVLAP